MKIRMVYVLTVITASLLLGSMSFAASTDAAQTFKGNCSMCHGADGKGYTAIHTPDFTSPKWQAKTTDKQIRDTIENGKKGTAMPAFSGKLTPAQIQGLVHYIRSFGSGKK